MTINELEKLIKQAKEKSPEIGDLELSVDHESLSGEWFFLKLPDQNNLMLCDGESYIAPTAKTWGLSE